MISKADIGQLKQLVAGLKAAFSGQSLIGTGILSSSNKPVKIGQTTKISVSSRADYKTKLSKGPDILFISFWNFVINFRKF